MKFIYCGYDFAIDTVERLIRDGHELVGIFSFPCDNVFSFNTRLHDLAQHLEIPITEDKPDQATMNEWTNKKCDLVLSIGYLYKIPLIDSKKAYAINIHPSRLPKGRGIMPLPHIIINHPEAAGITAHKITKDIDAGDILAQIPLIVNPDEDIEMISSRTAMALPDMTADLIENIKEQWKNAAPQDEEEATTFPEPTDAMRTINWGLNVETIKTLHRAFGRFGLLFGLGEEIWAAYALNGWEEEHQHNVGTICHTTNREIVIAAKNGYICITEAQKL